MAAVMTSLTLRETSRDDEPLLRALFAADRPAVLLDQQYGARAAAYSAAWPQRLDRVLEVHGRAVGRVLVGLGVGERRIVDVSVLPVHRGSGIGTAALRLVLAEADSAGEQVTLRVDRGSPARRLYERLGFTIHADEAVQHVMRREVCPMREGVQ